MEDVIRWSLDGIWPRVVVRGPYNVLHATSLGIEGETKDYIRMVKFPGQKIKVRLNVLGLNPRNGNTWSSKISSKGQLEIIMPLNES